MIYLEKRFKEVLCHLYVLFKDCNVFSFKVSAMCVCVYMIFHNLLTVII